MQTQRILMKVGQRGQKNIFVLDFFGCFCSLFTIVVKRVTNDCRIELVTFSATCREPSKKPSKSRVLLHDPLGVHPEEERRSVVGGGEHLTIQQ